MCQSITRALFLFFSARSLCLFGSNVTLEGKSSQQEEEAKAAKVNFLKDFRQLKMPDSLALTSA